MQTGTIIGKGGTRVKALEQQTGATLRVLHEQELPRCALADDRLLEIRGTSQQLCDAVQEVSGYVRSFLVDRSVIPLYDVHVRFICA